MKKLISVLSLVILVVSAHAQVILLDNFNSGSATGAVIGGTSWVGQVTQNASNIVVAGTAKDDNGWGTTSVNLDVSAMNFLNLTASVDAGNAASSFAIQFEDASLNTQIVSINLSNFSSSLGTFSQAVTWTTVDPSAITGWSIGGGNVGTTTFHMTFDNMSLSATAVPEPSTYAALAGVLALGFAAYRRRARTV